MITSFFVRYFRIIKHGLLFFITKDEAHVFEIENYYHIKKFTTSNISKMKSHFIVKNGERQTGEMSVFEAVEVLNKFKEPYTLEEVKEKNFEIHSFCRHWAIKQGEEINQRLVFNSKEEADEKWWEIKPNFISEKCEIVEVREFFIWYRKHDEKDFLNYYSDIENLEEAIEEVIKKYSAFSIFAIDYDGEVVARYGENFIKNPEKRR